MANVGVKAACLGAIGVATLWQGQQANADVIYTGATVAAPVDLSHTHVLYTSNVSVVQTDNSSLYSIPSPKGYATYEAGSIAVTGLTPNTSGTFDLDLSDAPTPALPDGQSTAGIVTSLTLVGLDANQQIVVSNSTGSSPNWNLLFGSNSYDSVVNALNSDSDTQIGGLVATPASTGTPTGYLFGTGYNGDPFNPFGLYTFSSMSASTAIQIDGNLATGSFALPTAVQTPEPATVAIVGAPLLAWTLGRRKRA